MMRYWHKENKYNCQYFSLCDGAPDFSSLSLSGKTGHDFIRDNDLMRTPYFSGYKPKTPGKNSQENRT